jgi:hypothetical protein
LSQTRGVIEDGFLIVRGRSSGIAAPEEIRAAIDAMELEILGKERCATAR